MGAGWLFVQVVGFFLPIQFILFPEERASEKGNPSSSLHHKNCKAFYPSAPSHRSNSLQVSRVLIYTEKYKHAHISCYLNAGNEEYFLADVNQYTYVRSREKQHDFGIAPAVFYRIYGDCSQLLLRHIVGCALPSAHVVRVVVGHLTKKIKTKGNRM